jgi:MarR family transcriptional regulator, 2-MHQ and catechol-resistance regulon repressor
MEHATRGADALITTFGRLVEAHARLSKELGDVLQREVGVSHAEFEVLLRVSRAQGGQISMGELAQQVALTSGGITKLVDRMIAAGLLQRVPCPTDRRVSFAELTKEGSATLARAVQVHGRNLEHVFAGLSERQLRTLDSLLDLLRAATLEGDSDVSA